MIVFNLSCANTHTFEGWFRSADDYESQRARSLVACPVCTNTAITKQLSAPYVNTGAPAPAPSAPAAPPAPAAAPAAPPTPGQALARAFISSHPELAALHQHLAREIRAKTTDVGKDFADEARAQHYGEVPERAIRGLATSRQIEELQDEGIDLLLLPEVIDGPIGH